MNYELVLYEVDDEEARKVEVDSIRLDEDEIQRAAEGDCDAVNDFFQETLDNS